MKKTIIFDFDGTITEYKNGWQGATTINELPVEGIKETIVTLREKYKVVVYSTRCHEIGGKEAIEKWLIDNDIEVDEVVNKKVPAFLQVDDRAINFNGNCKELLCNIENFEVWTKK